MRIESALTFPDLFIASWNKDFITVFWHWIFWQTIFEFITRKILLSKGIDNSCRMWRYTRALLLILCQICRKLFLKGFFWSLCFSGDFTSQICCICEISDRNHLTSSISIWSWSGMLILSSRISSSSEVSIYLLPFSTLTLATSWSSCTRVASAMFSVLVLVLNLLAGGSSLEEPGVLFLCMNISMSVSINL